MSLLVDGIRPAGYTSIFLSIIIFAPANEALTYSFSDQSGIWISPMTL